MKKNSTILRLIAMLVLSVMMISAFASCANTGDGTTTTEPEANNAGTTAPSGEEATSSDVDEQGYKLDDLPELNFGSQINILAWKDVEHEEFDKQKTAAVISLNSPSMTETLWSRKDLA